MLFKKSFSPVSKIKENHQIWWNFTRVGNADYEHWCRKIVTFQFAKMFKGQNRLPWVYIH